MAQAIPTKLPERQLIVAFDGVCNLCNGFVRFLLKRDKRGVFRFASSGSDAGAAIFADAEQDPLNPVSVVLLDGGVRYLESDAAIRAIAALGGPWRLAGAFRVVPAFIRDAAYRFVARRRYRWFGRTDSCPTPAIDQRDRFLA